MITCKNLSYKYQDNSKLALCDINLHIKKGEFIAILGSNGSGKSTLAKHFNALLTPTEGDCIITLPRHCEGACDRSNPATLKRQASSPTKDTGLLRPLCYALSPRNDELNTKDEVNLFKIRSNVGMVFQNPDNQIVSSIVEEDVAFALENLGVPPDQMRQRVDSALKAVDMLKYIKHAPHLLSGGQKQRIAIAGVLAMNPEIIVFDEPTAMLDPRGRKSIMRIIKALHKEGKTIIFITHNMQEVIGCDRLILLKEGNLMAEGTPDQIFSQIDLIRDCGLELPQVQQLLYNLSLVNS